MGQGFSGKKTQLGVRTTAAVKKLGCSNLKTMIEDNKLLTCDYEIISELTTFAQKHNSFEAEEGCNDDLAFIVFDVTQFPYKVVAKYRNNEIKPMLFPNVILDVAKGYNNAYLLVEVNDIGDQVASILQYDLEYENLLMASMRGRAG